MIACEARDEANDGGQRQCARRIRSENCSEAIEDRLTGSTEGEGSVHCYRRSAGVSDFAFDRDVG